MMMRVIYLYYYTVLSIIFAIKCCETFTAHPSYVLDTRIGRKLNNIINNNIGAVVKKTHLIRFADTVKAGDATERTTNGASSVKPESAQDEKSDAFAQREQNDHNGAGSEPSATEEKQTPAYVMKRTNFAIGNITEELLTLPRHVDHDGVNNVLIQSENAIKALHTYSQKLTDDDYDIDELLPEMSMEAHDRVFANQYIDFGKIDTVGFDYDYTLVTYTDELLDLIYDMALKRLVNDKQYPEEMLNAGLRYDPAFSIRGLAVDKEIAWICHLSYTHHVAVAWEGRQKVSTERIFKEYRGKRALRPQERKKRLKPLNDLFSMAECCLIADTVQFFKDHDIPFCPRNAVTDILNSIKETHISGDFHRIVADNPQRYFEATPHLKEVLDKLKSAGKRLIFVSNSPFWYVDAGMKYVIGEDWRKSWSAVITSAGKPAFYTQDERPFREVSYMTGRVKFKKVDKLEPGEVYAEGCLRQLTKLLHLPEKPVVEGSDSEINLDGDLIHERPSITTGAGRSSSLSSHNVLYIGDSLFADLVDAKREYGWTTAAVTPEVGFEIDRQGQTSFVLAQRTLDLLLNALRLCQEELGSNTRSNDDLVILDQLEKMVSKWRDRQTNMLGNPFGSIFRARYQPSLFAHSLRRYCDLYMSGVSALRNYSPQHRFYPEDTRLLGHEIRSAQELECWSLGLGDVISKNSIERDEELQ